MRLRTAAVAATSVLSAGAAVLVAGRYAADAALRPAHPGPHGGGPPPAGFQHTRLTVHSHGDGKVALTRSLAARLPGVYGLTGRGGTHAAVGRVLAAEAEDAHVHVTVRELQRVSRGQLTIGGTVRLTPQVYAGDPGEALGVEYADVEVPGELGPLPAWFVPAARSTWVITAHGLGATREHPLVMLPFYQRHHLPVLDLAYRGDPGAPRLLDGISHLGDAEWRDLDAAIRYAVRHGARRVILHGWSTGASMALYAAANSSLRDRISGLVLDSPVLDWQRTLRALAGAHRMPAPLLPLAVRAVQGRTGLCGGRLEAVSDPHRMTVPTLLLHGPDDHIAPWSHSRELADVRKDLISLHTVTDAPHAAMWNADPRGYEEAVRRFLVPLM